MAISTGFRHVGRITAAVFAVVSGSIGLLDVSLTYGATPAGASGKPPGPQPASGETKEKAGLPDLEWKEKAVSGQAILSQTANAPDACELKCTSNGTTLWSAKTCLANRRQSIFVSTDCEKILVVDPAVRVEPHRSWYHAVGVRLYARETLVRVGTLGALMAAQPRQHREDLERRGVHIDVISDQPNWDRNDVIRNGDEVVWLGKDASAKADGQGIELTLFPARKLTIGFDGKELSPVGEKKSKK